MVNRQRSEKCQTVRWYFFCSDLTLVPNTCSAMPCLWEKFITHVFLKNDKDYFKPKLVSVSDLNRYRIPWQIDQWCLPGSYIRHSPRNGIWNDMQACRSCKRFSCPVEYVCHCMIAYTGWLPECSAGECHSNSRLCDPTCTPCLTTLAVPAPAGWAGRSSPGCLRQHAVTDALQVPRHHWPQPPPVSTQQLHQVHWQWPRPLGLWLRWWRCGSQGDAGVTVDGVRRRLGWAAADASSAGKSGLVLWWHGCDSVLQIVYILWFAWGTFQNQSPVHRTVIEVNNPHPTAPTSQPPPMWILHNTVDQQGWTWPVVHNLWIYSHVRTKAMCTEQCLRSTTPLILSDFRTKAMCSEQWLRSATWLRSCA